MLFIVCMMLTMLMQGQEKKLVISHLTGNLYVYTTYKMLNGNPFPSNSMYMVTKRGVVMIDTPWDLEQMQPLLDSIKQKHNKEVVMCVVTHYHDDRSGGLDLLKEKGIQTYSTQQTWNISSERKEPKANYQFQNDTTFQLAGIQFKTFYPGEGHTKDNIVIWFPKERALFGGCLFKSTEVPNLGNVADANVERWPVAIRNVMQKFPGAEFVIPGHYGWSKPQALTHTLQLLETNLKKTNN
jgi:metallo-beta-lactamase class B